MNLVSKFLTRFIKSSKGESQFAASAIKTHRIAPLASRHVSLMTLHNMAKRNAVTRKMAGRSSVRTLNRSRALRYGK
jgi:hypothetical protein